MADAMINIIQQIFPFIEWILANGYGIYFFAVFLILFIAGLAYVSSDI